MSPPEWMRINFLLLSSLMMPNGRERGIFMMKTGEMKWNGGSQNTAAEEEEKAAKLGKFFVALFQKTRANGKNEDGEAGRNRSH